MNGDYSDALAEFCPDVDTLRQFAISDPGKGLLRAFDRTLIWCGLLNSRFSDKPQRVLNAAVHSKVIEIWILLPLGLYHAAYSSLRAIVDSTTAFGYYVSHPVEWDAVVNRGGGWEPRGEVIDFHTKFTRGFSDFNAQFGKAIRRGIPTPKLVKAGVLLPKT